MVVLKYCNSLLIVLSPAPISPVHFTYGCQNNLSKTHKKALMTSSVCQFKILQYESWIKNKIKTPWPGLKVTQDLIPAYLLHFYISCKDCLFYKHASKFSNNEILLSLWMEFPTRAPPLYYLTNYSTFSSLIKHQHLYEIYLIFPGWLSCFFPFVLIASSTMQISIIFFLSFFFLHVYLLWYSVYHNGRDCVCSSFTVPGI